MLQTRKTVLLLGDALALLISFACMIWWRFDTTADHSVIVTQTRVFGLLFIVWLIVLFIFDLYNIRRINPNPRTIGLIALSVIVNTAIGSIVFYLMPSLGIAPKINLLIVAGFSFIFLVGCRRLFYILFASRFKQTIAVIGEGPIVEHLLKDLAENPHIGQVVHTHREFLIEHSIPPVSVLIAHGVPMKTLLHIRQHIGCDVLSLFEAYEELFAKVPLALMDETMAISMITTQQHIGYKILERIVEISIAVFVLIVTSPFLFLVIIARLIEDGTPIFYTQRRVGKNGNIFSLYKLRSMKALSADGSAETNGAQWATQKDMRITRVGAVLRKTHIDEIPQMINILRGDLALIGPRPERPEIVQELEKQIPYYTLRHSIKPGFTGWAQIKFRYARTIIDSQEKFEYDLYYLLNKNPLLDFGILIKTIQIIFTH